MKQVMLAISILVAISVLVSACATPTPQVIEKEVIVTKEVEVVVTQEVEVIVTKEVEVEKEVIVTVEVEVPQPLVEETYKLRTPGVLTLGYNPAPGIVVVEDGQPVGVYSDIALEVAARLESVAEFQVVVAPHLTVVHPIQ